MGAASSERSSGRLADTRPPPVGALEDGSGEVTLVVYSVFMAATSLLLLLLAHVHQVHSGSSAADGAAPAFALASPRTWLAGLLAAVARLHGLVASAAALLAAIDIRTLLCTAAGLVTILSIAYWTNPSDASFRTYLADLSLRQHLRQLHEDAVPPQLAGKEAGAAELDALSLGGAEPERYASPHVLTFANRISISLRTPPYCRRDLGLFSVVSVTHVLTDGQRGGSTFSSRRPAPDGKVDCAHCGTMHAPGSQRSWFIGAFGRWFGGTLSCAFEARAERHVAAESAAGAAAARPYGVLSLSCQDDAATDNPAASSADGKDDSVDDHAGDAQSAAHGDASAATSATRSKAARRRKHPHKPRPNQPPPAKDPDRAPPNEASAQDASPTTTPRSADASSIHPPTDPTSTPSQQNKATNAGAASAAPAESDAAPSSALAALKSKLSTSSSAVSELQQQLEQLHTSSDSTRVQLQTQLDELRARKREDDAARIDLRGRMKSLDESKRHAEGSRREAERRLKAATSLREAIEGRIESKGREMEALREREIASAQRVETSKEHRVQRSKEIEEEMRAKHEAETALGEEIEQLNAKLVALEERILEEDANLEATRELAAERYRSMLHEASLEAAANQQHAALAGPLGQHMHGAPPSGHLSHLAPSHQYAPQQQVPHRMYPLLSGPGDGTQLRDSEPFGPQTFDAGWGTNGADMYGMPSDMHGLAPPRLVVSNGREAGFDPTFDPTRSLAHRSSDADAEFLPFFPDDKAEERRISNAGADASLLSTRRGAPGQMTLPPSNLLPRTPPPRGFQPNGPQTPFTPLSPFSTDLLPSNLFLNTDDDAGHVGILPGTRSERVEAALGRFGLDTSDTSDMEGGGGSDADTIDEAAELELGGPLEGLEAGQTLAAGAGQSDADDPQTAKGSRRSWWGGKARTPSKEASAAAPAEDAEASSDAASAELDASSKRRSLSLFPKLSLNPGAKAFRSSSRKQAAGGAVPMRGPLDSWPVGSQPAVPSDYEAVRRAFDTTVGADEEQGRRSWSAFDTWAHQGQVAQHEQQQQRAIPAQQQAAHARFGRGPFPRHPYLAGQSGLGPGGMRSSSDSLPHAASAAASREWPGSGDDVFNPIARTTSHPGSSVASSSPSNSEMRSSRLRSFFRAADGSKAAAAPKTFEAPEMLTPPASAGASHGDADADEAGVSAASPKSKRSAFRW